MSSLLDINLDDVGTLKTMADNEEVQLRIARAEIVPNKSDPSRNNLALTFDVPAEPLADDVRVWIPIPNAELKSEEPKRYIKQVNRLAECLAAFGARPPIETDSLLGLEGWGIVSEEEDPNGVMRNSVRRFITRK